MPYQSNPMMYPTVAPQAQTAYNSMSFYLGHVQTLYSSDGVMPVQYPQYGKQNNPNAWNAPMGYQSQGFHDRNKANEQKISHNRGYVTYSSNDYGSYVGKREEHRNEAYYGGHGSNHGRDQGMNQREYESPNRSRSPHGHGRYYDHDPSDNDNRDSDRYGYHDWNDSRDRQSNYERNYNRYDSNDHGRNDSRERDDFNYYERNSYDNQRHGDNRQEIRNIGDRNRFENRFSGRDRFSNNTSIYSAIPFGNKPAMDYGNKQVLNTFYKKINVQQNKDQPTKPNFPKSPVGPDTIQNYQELRTITLASSQRVIDDILRKVPERPSSPLLKELKSQIVTRVRSIVEQTKCNKVVKIQELYRKQYPDSDDAVLLESVLGAFIAPIQQPTGGNLNAGPRNNVKKKPPASTSVLQAGPPQGRLPRYPNKDKKVFKELKRAREQEEQPDFVPQVDPKYHSAVEEELNALKKVVMAACPPIDNKEGERIRKDLLSKRVEKFLKVIKIHLSKRLSDNFFGCVRVYFHHKPPTRASLDEFLKGYGVISLRKGMGKFFVATCNNAEGYDKLIAVRRKKLDGLNIGLIPFKVKDKGKKKKNKKKKSANIAPLDVDVSKNDLSCESDLKEMDIKEEPKIEKSKPIIEETLVKPDANIAEQAPIDEKPIINSKTTAVSDVKPLKDEKEITEPIVASAIDDGDLEDF